MKTLTRLISILFLFSCSKKEEQSTNPCYYDFYAGSTDCFARYFDRSNDPLLTDGKTYNFDLNNDSIPEISFLTHSQYSPYHYGDHPGYTELFRFSVSIKLGVGCSVNLNSFDQPDSITYGQLFKNSKKWSASEKEYTISSYLKTGEWVDSVGDVFKENYSGTFNTAKNKYLLLRLISNQDTTMSWFNISGKNHADVKILNYAYLSNK